VNQSYAIVALLRQIESNEGRAALRSGFCRRISDTRLVVQTCAIGFRAYLSNGAVGPV
jgi:hypothetical protein